MLIRYFEALGAIRRAISVVKKRTGPHERYVREMTITDDGVQIGEPLRQFSGVLSGLPSLPGELGQLSADENMTDDRVVVWAAPKDARLTCEFLTAAGLQCMPVTGWHEARAVLRLRGRAC